MTDRYYSEDGLLTTIKSKAADVEIEGYGRLDSILSRYRATMVLIDLIQANGLGFRLDLWEAAIADGLEKLKDTVCTFEIKQSNAQDGVSDDITMQARNGLS